MIFFLLLHFLGALQINAGTLPSAQKAAQPAMPAATPELILYTYESMVAPEGLGAALFPLFEKLHSCRIKALAVGDTGQLLGRLQIDAKRGKPTAHLVLGIDQHVWERAKPWIQSWGDWIPRGYDHLLRETRVENGFLPYDQSPLAFIADLDALRRLNLKVPVHFTDLLEPVWKRNLILEDPRTSAPGLAFVLAIDSVFGEKAWDFWKRFRGQWLTLTPGWDSAYRLFVKKEAPLIWSYLTSQAYHEEERRKASSSSLLPERYRAVLFEEGQPVQIEGAALVSGALTSPEQLRLARQFLEFLISPDVQALIPKKNWMLPVRKEISLPPSFAHLPKPKKILKTRSRAQEVADLLNRWNSTVGF